MKKIIKTFTLFLTLLLLMNLGWAQGAPANAPIAQSSLLDLFLKGGIIGFIITGLSVISMTLAILYFLQLKREKLIPQFIISDLEGMIEKDDQQKDTINHRCHINIGYNSLYFFSSSHVNPSLSQ